MASAFPTSVPDKDPDGATILTWTKPPPCPSDRPIANARRGRLDLNKADSGLAAAGAAGGLGALTAAASCCVLPLALAGAGVSASTLAPLVPLRLPLSLIALLAILAGWFFLYRRSRACAVDPVCSRPARSTKVMLIVASLFVLLSLAWPLFEPALVSALR